MNGLIAMRPAQGQPAYRLPSPSSLHDVYRPDPDRYPLSSAS